MAGAAHALTGHALIAAAIAVGIAAISAAIALFVLRVFRRAGTLHESSERRFRLLVEGVADHALYLMDADGRITDWNAGAQRLKGYTAEEIRGQKYEVFFPPEEREAGEPQHILDEAARLGKFSTQGWRVRKDGSRFFCNAVVTALRDPAGRLFGFAKITRDVTQSMQQQAELEQAHAALAQSQKMESLGQLTGGIAHDFNNFLHVIKNALEIVERHLGPDDTVAGRYVEMARRNADRAAAVTQRLLAFARRQPLAPKPLDPNRLIQGMGDLMRHALGSDVSIECVLAGGVWAICADVNQLETSILNLVINARDATRGAGRLTIETANTYLDEAYVSGHEDLAPGQYVMIAVSDTGIGMTREVIERAFDPFFTTKEPGHGTGLGLSQIFGFVKQSGGHVKIYSEVGEGTTVKLYFPRHGAPANAPVAPELPTPLAPPTAATILVVEDDADVRTFAVEMLTGFGYEVHSAPDAHAALTLLEQNPHVDLLFTDVGLPNGMNGRQLASEVKRRSPRTQVLFTTGYARNAIVHHGRLDPGVELLLKPYSQLDLGRKVHAALCGSASPLGAPD
jgi:PAS domain S-box-containing protein